jgi:hypothetical protein
MKVENEQQKWWDASDKIQERYFWMESSDPSGCNPSEVVLGIIEDGMKYYGPRWRRCKHGTPIGFDYNECGQCEEEAEEWERSAG